MNVKIRNAVVEDAGGIAEVRVVTWRKAYQGLLPDSVLSELTIEESTKSYTDGIAGLTPERAVFVAEVEDPHKRVVGYAICGPVREPGSQSTGEIYALYVLPDYQGQGIGRSMVQAAARWLAGQGFGRMLIFVLRDNAPARKFYKAIGGVMERERVREIEGFRAAEVGYGFRLFQTGLAIARAQNAPFASLNKRA